MQINKKNVIVPTAESDLSYYSQLDENKLSNEGNFYDDWKYMNSYLSSFYY